MAKNDFLPFATADGANVLSAEDYQKLRSRSNGFSAGVARSQELNTVWRQASVIAHVVAQFIADTNNSDVADDGDLDKLQAGLIQALSKNVNNTVPAASLNTVGITQLSSATDSDSETLAATPKAVKAAMDLAASSAVKSVNGKKGEVKLTAADVSALSLQGGTVNGSLKVESGINASGNVEAWDLKANGGVYDQGQRVYSSKNPPTSANLSQNGWYKDNTTGFIYQWGYIGSTNVTQNFPIAFPRNCLNVIVSNADAQGDTVDNAFGYPVNNASFHVATKGSIRGNITGFAVYWSAVGF